jgi:Cu(I)/Ag(I) efflux system periplasmic protein CusF
MKFVHWFLLALALVAAPVSVNATSHTSSASLIDGEVRKVDKETRKITIKHGPIANLDMPAMTMVYRLEDASLLDQFKPGDRVHFAADKAGGQYRIIRIELAR